MSNPNTKGLERREAPRLRHLSCALSCAFSIAAGMGALLGNPTSAHADIDPTSRGRNIDYSPHWAWGYDTLIGQNFQFKAAVLDDGVYYYEYFSTIQEAVSYTADMLDVAQALGDYDLQADVIGYGTLDDGKWYYWPNGFFGSGSGGDLPFPGGGYTGGGFGTGGGGASGSWGGTGASSSRGPETSNGTPPPSGSGYECTFYAVVNGNSAAPNSCQAIWNCNNGQTVTLTQPCNHEGPGPVPPGSAPLA